jgi:hypothetical protein
MPRARQSTALHGFAHCHGFGDLVQFAGPHIVDIPVDRNGLGDQRVVADAPDVGDEAGSVIFIGSSGFSVGDPQAWGGSLRVFRGRTGAWHTRWSA